ncbi:MAG TPA: hypothetical protein VKP52_14190 [Pseudolabrys sp.]|nr:hypothetical protein [Pseudolabrys sp.]
MALIDSENVKSAPSSALARIVARIKSLFAERNDSRLAQLVAGKVFLVRIGSALLALMSQVLLARWMQFRVRHLHLCMDLGADDRRALRCRSVIRCPPVHPGIHRAKALIACAAFSRAHAGSASPWRRVLPLSAQSA